jgi:hypothetical protein
LRAQLVVFCNLGSCGHVPLAVDTKMAMLVGETLVDTNEFLGA